MVQKGYLGRRWLKVGGRSYDRDRRKSLLFGESETPVGLRPPSVSDSPKHFCVGWNTLKKRKKLSKKKAHS